MVLDIQFVPPSHFVVWHRRAYLMFKPTKDTLVYMGFVHAWLVGVKDINAPSFDTGFYPIEYIHCGLGFITRPIHITNVNVQSHGPKLLSPMA